MKSMKIQITTIPVSHFYDYRLDVMFEGYKWDMQAGEESTISNQIVLIDKTEIDFLKKAAVALYEETVKMEHALKKRPDLVQKMGISEEMAAALCQCDYDPHQHVRFMRFDFHPTTEGWKISEVNSDVPAGYPEASILPKLAEKYVPNFSPCGDFGEVFTEKLKQLIPAQTTIAYLHDTHTVEDYQILHFIGDLMEKAGYNSAYLDPSHLNWEHNKAEKIGAIMRYYPVEWLEFAQNVDWRCFVNSKTPSSNHPIALLTQSKRLPLIWDDLQLEIPMWKQLLPETKCVTSCANKADFILKPAFGRVGEGINIPHTLSQEENLDILKAATEDPGQWVGQKMFESVPIDGLHLNLGVFVVEGEFAGLYARGSTKPRIDSDASEMPVLVGHIGS